MMFLMLLLLTILSPSSCQSGTPQKAFSGLANTLQERTRKHPKKTIIGLIAKCDGVNEFGKEISHILRKKMEMMKHVYYYLEINICEDEKYLAEVLVDLTLSPQLNINSSTKYWIKGVFAYLPDDLLKKTTALLSFTDIKIYALMKTGGCDRAWFENQKNLSPMFRSHKVTESIVAQLLTRYKWKNILIVEFFVQAKASVKIKNLMKSFRNVGIRYYALNGTSVLHNNTAYDIFSRIREDKNLQAVIIVDRMAALFLQNANNFGVKNVFWVMISNFGGTFTNMPEFICFQNVYNNNLIEKMPFYHNSASCNREFIGSQNNVSKKRRLRQNHCNIERFKSSSSKIIIEERIGNCFIEISGSKDEKNDIYQSLGKGKTISVEFLADTKQSELLRKSVERTQQDDQKTEAKTIPFCKLVDIKLFEKPEKKFNKQVDFYCSKCKPGYVSLNETCSTCSNGLMPLKNQTGCYNAIQEVKVYKIVFALNGIGIVLCFLILGVFFKFRHTPVARASHFMLTMTQTCCCLVLFISMTVCMTLPKTKYVCTARIILISLLLVSAIGIIVCKAERIISICCTKTLLDRKAKRDLLMKQMLIFAFIIFFDLIIIVSCFPVPSLPQQKPVSTDEYGNQYYKVVCDFGKTSWLQVAYCIFILMLSIIQAMRGHNRLPDAYNEGNAIITSSATTACCLLFLSIYSTHQGLYGEHFISVLSISLSISLIILLMCLYAGKIYIMLFQKKRNTKSFIKTYAKTLEYAAKYFEKRQNRRSRRGFSSSVMSTTITFSQSESTNVSPML